MQFRPPVMLFSAGRGTRMAPLTDDRPKPLVRVAGRPLIDHALDLLKAAPVGRIVANTHYLSDMLEDHLRGTGVETIREDRLLETGGGLRNALPRLGAGPVVTLNSDSVWHAGNPVSAMLNAWNPKKMDALLTLIRPEKAVGHRGGGDFSIGADGRLTRAPGLIYSGLQILNPAGLNEIEEDVFSLNRVWDRIAARGRLFGMVHDGDWCDVGQPENIPLAEDMLNV